jgi:prepilin-type N-terminal cleavage/methylation domain-containing protein
MPTARSRRGFTLAELLVVIIIMGILGVAFTKLIISQARFFQHEFGKKSGRAVARSAMNLLMSDMRMIQDSGGVDSVSADRHTVRVIVPFAYGLICVATGSPVYASLLPADSTEVTLAKYGGYAWRDSTKRYTIVVPAAPQGADSVHTAASGATCTTTPSPGIRTLTINGRVGRVITITPAAPTAKAGTPMFLWQKITYSFKPSTAFPGLYGLYRTPTGGTSEEILAPFDSSSGFKFYVPGKDTSQTTVPALSSIRGFDLVLNGVGPSVTVGMPPTITKMVTAVFFKNSRTF